MSDMQPLEKFVETYVKGPWEPTKEFVTYSQANQRFRIIIEEPRSLQDGFIGVWRDEKLAEQGINAPCEDAKEFAQALIDTLFYHLSPHQTGHIVKALQADLDKWQAERVALFPELKGDATCPY